MTQPSLDARFLLHEPTSPARPIYTDAYGFRHYHIVFSIRNASAQSNVYTVVYKLHESYVPPEVVSTEPPEFSVRLTSYGDYVIRAYLYSHDATKPHEIDGLLSDLLHRHHENEGNLTQEVMNAIHEIRSK